jgi:hypothetical protein
VGGRVAHEALQLAHDRAVAGDRRVQQTSDLLSSLVVDLADRRRQANRIKFNQILEHLIGFVTAPRLHLRFYQCVFAKYRTLYVVIPNGGRQRLLFNWEVIIGDDGVLSKVDDVPLDDRRPRWQSVAGAVVLILRLFVKLSTFKSSQFFTHNRKYRIDKETISIWDKNN